MYNGFVEMTDGLRRCTLANEEAFDVCPLPACSLEVTMNGGPVAVRNKGEAAQVSERLDLFDDVVVDKKIVAVGRVVVSSVFSLLLLLCVSGALLAALMFG